MRMLGATNVGGGTLLSARYDDGKCKIFLLADGQITERSPGGESVVAGYGNSYCKTENGVVRLKGEVPVYE